ncbi:MAG: WD40/YVTN/BNR-like repeat-containing protein [Candidatus Paceibacteria bacterium]
MTKAEYKKNLKGFAIIGCAVRNSHVFYFIARNLKQAEKASAISEESVGKRILPFFLDKPADGHNPRDGRWSASKLTGFGRLVGSASKLPIEKMVAVDGMSLVYAIGSGSSGIESPISELLGREAVGAITRVRTINDYIYAVGSAHTVCRRLGNNEWESLNFNLPRETQEIFDDEDLSYDMDFSDIAGFSPDDLYTVGGRGIVWHFDGKKKEWAQMKFPSDMYLWSVCCAGDGNVYIGAQSGTLFCGRENKWEMIHRGEFSLPFKDIVWHAGKVWCTSDYGLWTVEDGKLVSADVPAEITVCAGHLSVGDGVMLIAGDGGAAFHDGEKWQVIFNRLEMES